jgi:hypothetical protein
MGRNQVGIQQAQLIQIVGRSFAGNFQDFGDFPRCFRKMNLKGCTVFSGYFLRSLQVFSEQVPGLWQKRPGVIRSEN